MLKGNSEKILICRLSKFIIKNEAKALANHCELRYNFRRHKSCEDCSNHKYVPKEEIPDLINKHHYKTIA